MVSYNEYILIKKTGENHLYLGNDQSLTLAASER